MDKEGALPAAASMKGLKLVVIACILLLLGIGGWFLSQSRVENMTQSTLNRQRDLQQAVMDKTLDAIRVWREELLAQTRFVSSAEMFRLFMADASGLDAESLEKLSQPDALHSQDEGIRLLAEQHAYIQDLLSDLTQRRAWNEARIVNTNGADIVCKDFASPLTPEQKSLTAKSVESGQPSFGPVRHGSNGLVMDVADPLFEVMGMGEPKCIGALLVTVPMDRILSTFLVSTGNQGGGMVSRIIDRSSKPASVLFMRGNFLQMEALPASFKLANVETLPFGRRDDLVGGGNVYSMGANVTMLDWLLAVETPAEIIDAAIEDESFRAYAFVILGLFAVALIIAYVWKLVASRAEALKHQEQEQLHAKINQQKLILDSINASLDTGLLLVDDKGYIRFANPAFYRICGAKQGSGIDAPLPEILRGPVSVQLISNMVRVREQGKNASIELEIPSADGEKRLYRVNLFPYSALPEETVTSGNGCVAVFQDITAFRARSQRDKQRQQAMLMAMDRAMASVDANLVGESSKMAKVAQLLAEKLGLSEEQQDTLRLSAQLSQIGKLFVPRELLLKKGKLTDEERHEVARAPEYADNILHDLHFGLPVQQTVHEMGERMDGSGPGGMTGENISMCGRVLAVASALVGMTSPRSWRSGKSLSAQDAVDILQKDAKFDPHVTAALAALDPVALLAIIGLPRQQKSENEA